MTPLLAVICAIHIDINNIYLCKLRSFTSKALAWVDSSQGKTFSNNFSKLEQRQWRQILCSWSKFHLFICWWLTSCSEFLSSKRLKSKSLHIDSGLTWNEALLYNFRCLIFIRTSTFLYMWILNYLFFYFDLFLKNNPVPE